MLTAIEPLSLPSVVGSKALFGNSNNPEHSGGAAKPQGNTYFDQYTLLVNSNTWIKLRAVYHSFNNSRICKKKKRFSLV